MSRSYKVIRVVVCAAILLGCLLASQVLASDTKPISNKVAEVVSRIEAINMVQFPWPPLYGEQLEQHANFMYLVATASCDEIISLTDHQSGVVRCYAFWALSYEESIELFPIVLNHLNDTEMVSISGDPGFRRQMSEQKVGDVIVSLALGDMPFFVTPSNCYQIDSLQREMLDSVLILGSFDLYAQARAISRAKPKEYLHSRLRELVRKGNHPVAIEALASYQDEQDYDLILKNRTYRAISLFPHPDFFELLRADLKKILVAYVGTEEWDYYQAIASYENAEAVGLFEIPLIVVMDDFDRKDHVDAVFAAVRKHKISAFNDLLWKLWIEERRITRDVLDYFMSLRSDEMYESVKVALLDMDKVYNANIETDYACWSCSTDTVLAAMLDLVFEHDSTDGFELVITNLRKADVHLFPIFAEVAIQTKQPSLVEPLFARLEREDNPHIYLEVANALLAYDDEPINKRIIKSRKLNENLTKGWGSQAFDSLLRVHGLE